MSMEELLGT